MTNLWGFLLQTLTVSLVAVFLLALKCLLEDKLSPRWQYGIWALLAARLLLPVDVSREVLVPLPLWMEMIKTNAEQWWIGLAGAGSAFAGVYAPVRIVVGIPWVSGAPTSLWDWLFVVYVAGIFVVLARYLTSYVRLRALLRRGEPVWPEMRTRIDTVCARYGLRPCLAVEVPGLTSAFICGVLRPVLAIPANQEPDDKVLLHELLHLYHRDALQNLVWCVLRALHWCNPFLQYVFDRIGNDMETLCDQRVLELLEGEARREYGHILLDMANEAYARVPGTTSLSNGGKNIARRIEAVVRFKKYPRGMGLVSVCIVILLAGPLLQGEAQANALSDYLPGEAAEWEQAMAMTRLNRCTTVAGALDTYAKGLVLENGIYIATATSLACQKELTERMRYHREEEGWVAYHLDSGAELEYAERNYYLYNVKERDDGSYEAVLEIPVQYFEKAEGEGFVLDESGEPQGGVVQVPVRVDWENGWVVEETGPRQRILLKEFEQDDMERRVPALVTYQAQSEYGKIEVGVWTKYEVENQEAVTNFWGWMEEGFSEIPSPHAKFSAGHETIQTKYEWAPESEDAVRPYEQVGVARTLRMPEDVSELRERGVNESGSSSDGYSWTCAAIDSTWDGTVLDGGGQGYYDLGERLIEVHTYFVVGITWDRELVEVFELGEVTR